MVLLSILKKLRRKEKEMRLLLVGLDNAGKSTILSRINGEEIDSVAPTLGFNIKTFNYADYVLNVWDVGRFQLTRFYCFFSEWMIFSLRWTEITSILLAKLFRSNRSHHLGC